MKVQIKNRWTGAVLFECYVPHGVESSLAMRYALEEAVKAGADLTGANLTGANLTSANLAGSDLTGADLTSVKLTGAKWRSGIVITLVAVVALAMLAGWFVGYLKVSSACEIAGGRLQTEHLGIRPVCVVPKGLV